jgi:hypothetical protein
MNRKSSCYRAWRRPPNPSQPPMNRSVTPPANGAKECPGRPGSNGIAPQESRRRSRLGGSTAVARGKMGSHPKHRQQSADRSDPRMAGPHRRCESDSWHPVFNRGNRGNASFAPLTTGATFASCPNSPGGVHGGRRLPEVVARIEVKAMGSVPYY